MGKEQGHRIARREFVEWLSKGVVVAGAVGAGNIGESAARTEPGTGPSGASQAATMPYVTLGRTGLRVSKIALGTNPPTSRPVLAYCIEQGVNYIDSAEIYAGGRAEKVLGQLFEQLRLDRRKFILSTKTFNRRTDQWPSRIEAACKRLRTDYVDLFFIHDLGRNRRMVSDRDPRWIHSREVVEAIKALKKNGLVRFVGFSFHRRRPEYSQALLREAAKSKVIDIVMLQYSFRDENNEPLRQAMATARKAGVGIIAVKPQGGNTPEPEVLQSYLSPGFNRWQAAIRWLANDPHVDVICSNMLNIKQARENIAAVKSPRLKSAELDRLRMYALATSSLYCRACESCLETCPQGIDIPTIQRTLVYHDNYGAAELARQTYAALEPDRRADRCLGCGSCERACPSGLAIRRNIERAADLFADLPYLPS